MNEIGYRRFEEKIDKLRKIYNVDETNIHRRKYHVITTKNAKGNGGYHVDWDMPNIKAYTFL